MINKTLKDIEESRPFFELLSRKNLDSKLRQTLINKAPNSFYSIITQLSRHILNKTLKIFKKGFCKKFENSVYLFALPATNIQDKRKILETENFEFILLIWKIVSKEILSKK